MLAHQVVLPTPSVSLRLPNYSPSSRTNKQLPFCGHSSKFRILQVLCLPLFQKMPRCVPTIPIPVLATHRSPLHASPFFSHSCALFCATKNSTLLFSCDSELFAQNTRGWGIPTALMSHENLLFPRARPTMNLQLSPASIPTRSGWMRLSVFEFRISSFDFRSLRFRHARSRHRFRHTHSRWPRL